MSNRRNKERRKVARAQKNMKKDSYLNRSKTHIQRIVRIFLNLRTCLESHRLKWPKIQACLIKRLNFGCKSFTPPRHIPIWLVVVHDFRSKFRRFIEAWDSKQVLTENTLVLTFASTLKWALLSFGALRSATVRAEQIFSKKLCVHQRTIGRTASMHQYSPSLRLTE